MKLTQQILLVVLLVMVSAAVANDYLTPAGPPGSAQTQMRTMNEIEPHEVISRLPTNINSSGSYILTGNLSGSNGASGITIAASDVTINLNGFSMVGTTGSHNGIYVSGSRQHIYVRNGTMRGWGGYAISSSGAINSRYEDLLISTNGYLDTVNAFYVGANSIVERCTFLNNYGTGAYMSDGCKVENCISRDNNGYGFFSGKNCIIRNCTATDNTYSGVRTTDNSVISDCNAIGNGNNGFYATKNTTFSRCSSATNVLDGFNTSQGCSLSDCTATANSNGFSLALGTTIRGCSAYMNREDGIRSTTAINVQGCSSANNGDDGIDATDGSLVSDCVANGHTGSGSAGIRAGTYTRAVNNVCKGNYYGIYTAGKAFIADNSVSSNTNGIYAGATGKAIVIRNYAVDNSGADYNVTSANAAGTVFTNTGTITNTSPWVNFAY